MTTFEILSTDWGAFGYVATDGRLQATWLPQPKPEMLARIRREWPDAVEARGVLPTLGDAVSAYFAGDPVEFNVPLDLEKFTPFQQSVLKACARLRYGQTASYADLARSAGRPLAARAVGNTMARNTCPLVIPCHRVLRCGGGLGGFSGPDGTALKQRMLDWEAEHSGAALVKAARGARTVRAAERVLAGVA